MQDKRKARKLNSVVFGVIFVMHLKLEEAFYNRKGKKGLA